MMHSRYCLFVRISLIADGPQRARFFTNFTYCNVAILLMPVVTKDLSIFTRFSPTNFYRDVIPALLHLVNR